MDTDMSTGNAAGDEREWRDQLKKSREALAEARRREEELEGVVREGERAMRELEEWTARKVDAMSALTAVLREEWLAGAVLSRAEGARKRARMEDGSPSHAMMVMESETRTQEIEEERGFEQVEGGSDEAQDEQANEVEGEAGLGTGSEPGEEQGAEQESEKWAEQGAEQWAEQWAGEGRAGDVDRESVGQAVAGEGAVQEEVFDNLSMVQCSPLHPNPPLISSNPSPAIQLLPPFALTFLLSFQSFPHVNPPRSSSVPPQPLISVGHSAGSRGAARVDSGGAVTANVERRAHMGGGEGWMGRAGGMHMQLKVDGRASEAEVMARLQRKVNGLLLHVPPDKQEKAIEKIDSVVRCLANQDTTVKELSLPPYSLSYYLLLTPHCYPGFLQSVSTLVLNNLSRQPEMVMPSVANQLLRLSSLTALHLRETYIASSALPLFQSATRLRQLVIACYSPFDLLPNPPANRQPNLPAQSDPASPLQRVQPFAGLRELHVSRVSDSFLQQVGLLTSLEALSCTSSKGVSSTGWIHLKRLLNLKRLQLAPTLPVKIDIIGEMRKVGSNDHPNENSYLHHHFGPKLSFSGSRLPEITRSFQRPAKKGTAAASGDGDPDGNRIDGSIWEVVGALIGLEHLELHAAEPSATALRSVSSIRRLKSLRITSTALDASDLLCLRTLSLLTDLSLAACTFAADQSVRSVIQGMTQLQSLDLSGTAISQAAAVHLQALGQLERLKLQQISGMSKLFVEHVSRVPALRELDLGCNNMQHAWLLPVLEGKKVTRLGVSGCCFVAKTVERLQRAWIEIDARTWVYAAGRSVSVLLGACCHSLVDRSPYSAQAPAPRNKRHASSRHTDLVAVSQNPLAERLQARGFALRFRHSDFFNVAGAPPMPLAVTSEIFRALNRSEPAFLNVLLDVAAASLFHRAFFSRRPGVLTWQASSIAACDITSLPVSLPRLPALTELTLDMDQIPVLPEDFGQLSVLRTLVLKMRSLTALPDSMALLTTLQELSLHYLRSLTCLPQEFGQLALRELKFLECRQLQQLPDSVSQLSCLEHLEFSICPRLTGLPVDLGKGMHALRHLLLLDCTALSRLPPSFSGLTSLETLKILHAKRFRGTLLDGFGSLKSLKELSVVSLPRLSALPASFSGVESLTRLEVGKCPNVTVLPEEIGRLRALEEVRIFGMDALRCLPTSLLELPSLRALDVRACDALTLPETLGGLAGLRVLQLVYLYSIRQLPESLGQLKMLETLDIIDCFELMQLPKSFVNLPKLQSCSLVKVAVSTIPDDIWKLSSLKKLLILGLKRLRSLPGSFTRLPKLEELEVCACKKLARLPPSLQRMPTLRECTIRECPLLSQRATRGVPARREEGEEGEGEVGEGGDSEEEEGEEGGNGEEMEEEESDGDDEDIEHELVLDSDYDDDISGGYGGSSSDDDE
ncbi:unnamed protein product [Closterium sp. Yama58-4]|nr:unnamed protein product [Closterium sp. Yama58-4]